ncbi:transketolase, partial [Achromatium sp. WMS2]
KPQILVLTADLTASCEVDFFRQTYPDRFISMGMAEQNMMSWAGGLAREGLEPWIHSFAVFTCRRPFDQVAMSIGYPNLKVRIVGFLPGITTPGGVTHQAIDDVGLMRLIPNMTVLVTGDATEVETVLDIAHNTPGPVYISMLRGEMPRLFDTPMNNQVRVLSTGQDVAIISMGISTAEANLARYWLQKSANCSIQHIHVNCIKPLDEDSIIKAISHVKYGVAVVENHSVIGGLSSAIAELISRYNLGKRLVSRCIMDVYAHGASRAYLMKEMGIDAISIVHAVGEVLGKQLIVKEQDLAAMPIQDVQGSTNVEAL